MFKFAQCHEVFPRACVDVHPGLCVYWCVREVNLDEFQKKISSLEDESSGFN